MNDAERNLAAAVAVRDRVKIRLAEHEAAGKKILAQSDRRLLEIQDETIAYWSDKLNHK